MFGLFASKWEKSKKKYLDGKITLQDFLSENANQTLYSSTPFGEDIHGNNALWAIATKRDSEGYYPLFSTANACRDFLMAIGRAGGFVIVGSTLFESFETLNDIPPLRDFGVVIDPHTRNPIYISHYNIPNRKFEQDTKEEEK